MRSLKLTGVLPLMLALAVAGAACSKSNGGSPLAPSAPAASLPAATGGATISGVVVTGAQTTGFASTGDGSGFALLAGGSFTISVNGTNITVTSNADGSFTLQGVPAGDITLTISGNGANAQVTINGVELNEQVRVTIRVNGGTAELDDESQIADGRAEIEGRIVSVSGRTLVVGSLATSVLVPDGTPIRHGGTPRQFAELQPGVRIHVKATRAGEVLTATEVNLQNDNPRAGGSGSSSDDDDAEVSGALVGPITGTCPAVSFSVNGKTVTTNASTKFDDVTCATLAAGQMVKVEGALQGDGSILAEEVERKDASDDDDDDDEDDEDEAEVSGAISGTITGSCPALTFSVNGKTVKTNASTQFDNVTCSTLVSGDTVKVEGAMQLDGSILATEVEKESTTSGGSSSSNKGRR